MPRCWVAGPSMTFWSRCILAQASSHSVHLHVISVPESVRGRRALAIEPRITKDHTAQQLTDWTSADLVSSSSATWDLCGLTFVAFRRQPFHTLPPTPRSNISMSRVTITIPDADDDYPNHARATQAPEPTLMNPRGSEKLATWTTSQPDRFNQPGFQHREER
jgi:hypothetical protein